jgi:acyl-CoA synthetase (NDP forming)
MTQKKDLTTLFAPRAVAVIGASEKPGRVGSIVFENLLRSGRKVYPVHPRAKKIKNVPVIHEIADLPPEVDLAIVTIGAKGAVAAAEACAKRAIAHIIVVAGGFSEAGPEGQKLEDRLRAIPRAYSSRILGPNTLGLFVPHERLDTIFVEHGDQALAGGGGVAFITQSGSVGVEALGLASNTGFGMRAFVGLGNKCDLDELDFLDHFAQDPGTTCLAFYIESLAEGREFLAAARQTAHKKPIVALKAGRTAAGASAVSSHTGRLAGSDRVVDGAFRQHGVIRVVDDEDLCDAAKTLAALPPAPGNRVAIVTPAGGYGVMGADHVESIAGRPKLKMARLSAKTESWIQKNTLPFASPHNPVDLTASATDEMFGAALDALIDDSGVDIVICTAFFAPPGITSALIDQIARRTDASKKPIIAFTQYGPFTDEHLRLFHQQGVVGFPSIKRAVRAAQVLVERSEILAALGGSP